MVLKCLVECFAAAAHFGLDDGLHLIFKSLPLLRAFGSEVGLADIEDIVVTEHILAFPGLLLIGRKVQIFLGADALPILLVPVLEPHYRKALLPFRNTYPEPVRLVPGHEERYLPTLVVAQEGEKQPVAPGVLAARDIPRTCRVGGNPRFPPTVGIYLIELRDEQVGIALGHFSCICHISGSSPSSFRCPRPVSPRGFPSSSGLPSQPSAPPSAIPDG